MNQVICGALLAIGLLFAACNNENNKNNGGAKTLSDMAKKNTDKVPYTLAKNYFVRKDFDADKFLTPKITTAEEFEKIFGMATVMGNEGKPTPVDFTKQYALAVILPVAERSVKLKVDKLQQTKDQLILRYKEEDETASTMKSQPFLLLFVDKKYDKDPAVQQVD